MYYHLGSINFALMQQEDKARVIEQYTKAMNMIPFGFRAEIIIYRKNVFLKVNAPDSMFSYIKNSLQEICPVYPAEEKCTKRFASLPFSKGKMCEYWGKELDPLFLPRMIQDWSIIRITVTPVQSKSAVNVVKKCGAAGAKRDSGSAANPDIENAIRQAKLLRESVMQNLHKCCEVRLEVLTTGKTAKIRQDRMRQLVSTAEDDGVLLCNSNESEFAKFFRSRLHHTSRICTEKIFGNLIPFTYCTRADEKGFSYGRDCCDDRISVKRRCFSLPSGIISGHGCNTMMWHEIHEVLKSTEDSIVVADLSDFSESKADDTRIKLFSEYEKNFINPLDIFLPDAEFGTLEEVLSEIQCAALFMFRELSGRELSQDETDVAAQSCDAVFRPFTKSLKKQGKHCDFDRNPIFYDILKALSKSGKADGLVKAVYNNMKTVELFSHHTCVPQRTVLTLNFGYDFNWNYAAVGEMAVLHYMHILGQKNTRFTEKHRIWAYFENLENWRPECAEWLLRFYKKSRVNGVIPTACVRDYAKFVSSDAGEAIACNSQFTIFLSQDSKSADIIRQKYGFCESEMYYLTEPMQGSILICVGEKPPIIANVSACFKNIIEALPNF